MESAKEELSRSLICLLLEEPFYGHLLSGIVRSLTTRIETAAVANNEGHVELWINPDYFLSLSAGERVAVLKHESLHLVFKHLFREPNDASHDNPLLWNIAADLVVNQFIGSKWPLPEDAITLADFAAFNLRPNRTIQEYYESLLKHSIALPICGHGQRGAKGGHSDHSQWKNASDTLGRISQESLARQIENAKHRTSGKYWSQLPSEIRRRVDEIMNRRNPSVNWRRVLRLFSASVRRNQVQLTKRRESKRYNTIPGLKFKRIQRIAVVIDTSGSIQVEELELFFSEIHAMWKANAEIHIIEADSTLQRQYLYDGKLPLFTMGGGGTSFDPAFAYLKADRHKRFDGCIYLTDGYASAPEVKPPCKLLWVISPEGHVGDHLKYGRAIQLPGSSQERSR